MSDAQRPAPRPLTGGAVMSAASRVAVAVTGALTTVAVARLLGPDGAGTFSIALTLIYVLTVVGTLGVEHGVAYYVSTGDWPARHAFVVVQVVAVAVGVPLAALTLVVRDLVPSAFADLTFGMTLIVVAALPFALAWFYATFVALAVDRYEAYVVPPALLSSIALVAVTVLAEVDGVRGAVIGLSVAHAITAIVALVWARRWLPAAEVLARTRHHLTRAVSFGMRGYAANALQILNYRLDLFVLSAVASSAAVGRYAVAMSVTSVLLLLPPALSDLVFPRVAALSAGGDDAAAHRELVEVKSLRHTTILVAVSSVVVAVALVALVVPVYGSDFQQAIVLGLILLPGVALIGMAGVLSATIVGRGRPGLMLRIALMVTPVTVVLYFLLIPWLDAEGAALASSISYAMGFALAAVYYRRVTGRGVARTLLPTRSELADYHALPAAVRAWAAGLRRR